MKREGVLVVGSANMDLVVTVQRFPKPGETIFGNKFEMFPGGKGANQAVSASRLGRRTFFIGKMGKDNFSDKLIENLKYEGVDLSHLIIDKNENTGTALISVDAKGENQIIVISGGNMKITSAEIECKKNVFEKVKVVISQLEIPIDAVMKTAQLAKTNGIPFILNPAPASVLPRELLKIVDYLTPNENELSMLANIKLNTNQSIKNAAYKLIKDGVKNVIVTLGEKGAALFNADTEKYFSAPFVNAVDSTGAGDAFNGALAFALSNEKEIEKAIQFAVSAASYSVTKMGAQSSMPKLQDVEPYKIAN